MLLRPYGEYYGDYAEKVAELLSTFPLGQPIVGEAAQKAFITLFGAILRLQLKPLLLFQFSGILSTTASKEIAPCCIIFNFKFALKRREYFCYYFIFYKREIFSSASRAGKGSGGRPSVNKRSICDSVPTSTIAGRLNLLPSAASQTSRA